MSIFEVEHQPRAHRVIQQALASRRMPHAYLFTGPEGVGKEMLASRLAATLLCSSPVRRPMPEAVGQVTPDGRGLDACGQCPDCQYLRAGTHPDLFLIYRQLNKQHPDSDIRKQKALGLSIDVIRHFLIARAGTRPMRGRAKVFIVREAERLNDKAQNCLLKTLEEPPDGTFIILLTRAVDRLLPTIQSRCQHVEFGALPAEYVAARLGELRPEADAAERDYVARHAGGSVGTALRHMDDGLFALKRAWGERLVQLVDPQQGSYPHLLAGPLIRDAKALGKCVVDRDRDVSETDATRAGLRDLLAVLADFYGDALRGATGTGLPPINADQPGVVQALVGTHRAADLTAALAQISLADDYLGRNVHVELTIETLFIRLAGIARRAVKRIGTVEEG